MAGFMGWRMRGVTAAIREDQYAHTTPLGTVPNECPTCAEVRNMTCYRLPEGPLGRHTGLHLVCPVCGSAWSVDRDDQAKVLDKLTT